MEAVLVRHAPVRQLIENGWAASLQRPMRQGTSGDVWPWGLALGAGQLLIDLTFTVS